MGGDITEVLGRVREGDEAARNQLVELVYRELRRIAGGHMRRESPAHILQPSALVNEAFIRLLKENAGFQDRAHFFAVASTMMRRILVDHARAGKAAKRGGEAVRVDRLDTSKQPAASSRPVEMLLLDGALARLAGVDPRQAQLVEMRYFGGMSNEEIAEVMGLSVRTVIREWQAARAWLHAELSN